jgi:diguanylate cyclase (GGDEF)-like protein
MSVVHTNRGGGNETLTRHGGPEAPLPLRIILVGRTGLDAKLRLDPNVELIRASTALEAVGELADGTGEPVASGNVVIISAEADPAASRDSSGLVRTDSGRASEFLAAMRGIDPHVRILRLESDDGSAPVRAGYDGIVAENADAQALRAAVRGVMEPATLARQSPESEPAFLPERSRTSAARARTHPPARPVAPERPATLPITERDEIASLVDTLLGDPVPAIAPVASPPSGSPTAPILGDLEIGDDALVRQLLQGRDFLDAATELLHRRLGSKDAWFEPASQAEAAALPGATAAHECPVVWRDQHLGRIRSAAIPAGRLAPHAAWLGAWIALRDQHAQLREAAFTDPLTGANNRRFFDHFLTSAIDVARTNRRSLTVLAFDIDNFKHFNDQFGHAAGDEILRETVKLLKSVIRPSDRVCRIGGDEFVVIFHEPEGPRSATSRPPSSVFEIAQRFQQAVCSQKFPKLGRDAPGTLGISGGLATYPWDGATAEELLNRADDLALQSKKVGKNCITFGPGAQIAHGPCETDTLAPDA